MESCLGNAAVEGEDGVQYITPLHLSETSSIFILIVKTILHLPIISCHLEAVYHPQPCCTMLIHHPSSSSLSTSSTSLPDNIKGVHCAASITSPRHLPGTSSILPATHICSIKGYFIIWYRGKTDYCLHSLHFEPNSDLGILHLLMTINHASMLQWELQVVSFQCLIFQIVSSKIRNLIPIWKIFWLERTLLTEPWSQRSRIYIIGIISDSSYKNYFLFEWSGINLFWKASM